MAPIAMIMAMCTMPGQSVGVAAFNASIRTELDLNATQFASCYALGTIIASLLLPFAGSAIDRFGIRRTAMLIAPGLCGACYFIGSVTGLTSLFFAFLLLRFLGQGSLSLCSQNTLAMWFDQRLGRVAGVTSTLVTLFMASTPLWLRAAIEQFGWRATYEWLGVGVLVILFPMLLFFRNQPEDIGQVPDGLAAPPADDLSDSTVASPARSGAPVIEGLTFPEALRESSYWILIAMNVVWSMVGTSLIFDVQSLGESLVGTDVVTIGSYRLPVDAANTCFFISVGVMNLIGGFLADRFSLTKLLRIAIIGMLTGLVMLILSRGLVPLFLAYGVYGLSQGLLSAVSNTIWPRFFGRAHLGKIRGGSMMAMVAGSSAGPLIMGFAYDQTGSHRVPLIFFAACTATALLAVFFIHRPKNRSGKTAA